MPDNMEPGARVSERWSPGRAPGVVLPAVAAGSCRGGRRAHRRSAAVPRRGHKDAAGNRRRTGFVADAGALAAIPGARLAVPPTLQASLPARLDRLGRAAKEVAQGGAAIGRGFSYDLLCAASRRLEAETQAVLSQLVAAGLLFQRGEPPAAQNQFKTRWCRTPPTARCCAARARRCMGESPRRLRRTPRNASNASRKFSPIISSSG